MNMKISYLYRDASNYKQYEEGDDLDLHELESVVRTEEQASAGLFHVD